MPLPSYEDYQRNFAERQAKLASEMQAAGIIKVGNKFYQKSDLTRGNLGVGQAAQDLEDDQYLSLDEAAALGLPYGTKKRDARGTGTIPKSSKAPTPTIESLKAAGYASRFESAEPDLVNSYSKVPQLEFYLNRIIPNFAQSDAFQSFDQAARELIAANLRKESGAQISDREYQDAKLRYIPVPGDKPEVVKQKEKTRKKILEGIKNEAIQGMATLANNTFATEQEAEAAGLPPGTEIIVNGRRAIVE